MDCIQSQNVNGISEEVNAMSLSFACEGSGNTDKENNDVAVQNRDVVDSKHQPILPSLKDSSRSTSRPSVTKAGAIAGGSSSSMVSTESKPSTLPENEKGATDTPTNAAKEMAPIIRTPKRQGYLSWEDFFMGVAVLSSKRSKDPISPTGACIVDKQQRIVGIGYNGFPRGCSDDVFPWTTGATNDDEDLPWLHTPEPYMCHAVTNAILNKCSHDVEGCSLYVTQYPCSDCAKMIIQSRISKVVVRKVEDSSTCLGCNSSLPLLNNEGNETTVDPDTRASQILLEMANVDVQYYRPTVKSLTIDFGKIENSVAMTESDVAKSACDTDEETMQQYGKIEEASPMLVKGDDDERTKIAHELLWEEARYDPRSSQNCKRGDYISWSEYFMAMAFLSAQRSKDPNTQVGACIVDADKRIVGLGYNGFPRGCSDNDLPWAKVNDNPLYNKYVYVCHAEVNAILNKGSANVKGSTIYVALFPCQNCAKMIIQSGIKEVVYSNDKNHDSDGCRASRIMLQLAGVKLRRYVPSMQTMELNFDF